MALLSGLRVGGLHVWLCWIDLLGGFDAWWLVCLVGLILVRSFVWICCVLGYLVCVITIVPGVI